MYSFLKKKRFVRLLMQPNGFALPTVLIASVVMLGVLTVSLQATASTHVALTEQLRAQQLKEAVESGGVMAQYCHSIGAIWSQPLKPGTDCSGVQRSGCPAGTNACNYVLQSSTYDTSFSVPAPTGSGLKYTFYVTGIFDLKRVSDGSVAQTRSQSTYRNITYTSLTPIKGGNYSTCAITSGQLYCWGYNYYGQSGNPDNVASTQDSPYHVVFPSPIQYVYDVSPGYYHTCAIAGTTPTPSINDSQLYCWGYSNNGQFGDGTLMTDRTQIQRTPKLVWGQLSTYAYTNVSGRDNTCVTYETNPGAMTGTKNVRCWGSNDYGQSGDNASGAASTDADTSVLLDPKVSHGNYNIKDRSSGANLDGIVALDAVSQRNGCVITGLTSTRYVSCWGTNGLGQVGNSVHTGWDTRSAQTSTLTQAQVLYTNNNRACALNGTAATSRRIFCWGSNGYNNIDYRISVDLATMINDAPVAMDTGAGASAPINVRTASDYITDFAMADGSICFLKNTGKIYCWGYNDDGQLGQGAANGPAFSNNVTPTISGSGATQRPLSPVNAVQVHGQNNELDGQNFVTIAAGYGNFCAITDRGKTYCWGSDQFGELGVGYHLSTGCMCEAWPKSVSLPIHSLNY